MLTSEHQPPILSITTFFFRTLRKNARDCSQKLFSQGRAWRLKYSKESSICPMPGVGSDSDTIGCEGGAYVRIGFEP